MNDLDELLIYKQYLEMIYYMENITIKYPKSERFSMVSQIKNTTYDGMKLIIKAQKQYDKQKKLSILSELDVNLKMLKVLIRVSYKRKYISIRNYNAWSKKIFNIGNLLGSWIGVCVKR